MPKQPNLLFIWTDEQRADTLACYGGNTVQAPNLNRLAQRSFVFQNAYCTQSVCTPSRASILTGLWPHTHGCVRNNTRLSPEIPVLAEMMHEEYQCAYYGKWHLGDEIVAQRGFEDWISIEDGIYRSYYSRPEYLERRSTYHHFLIEQGYTPDTRAADGARVFSREFCAALAQPYTKAGFLGQRAAQFLRGQNGDRPFALSVNFLEPHMPFFGPLNNLYDPAALPTGPAFAQAPPADASLRNRLFSAHYTQRGHDGYPLQTPENFRRIRANYFGLTTMVDNAVGEILAALEASGQAENTVIVFTSDHGDLMGDHAMVGKCVMYQEAIRIPLMVHVPWLNPRPIGGRISQVDLLPTVLEVLGQEIPTHIQGQSRAGLFEATPAQDEIELADVVIEWNPDDPATGPTPPEGYTNENMEMVTQQSWRTLVTGEGWKINVSDQDESCEMVDLNDDPYEQKNLWQEKTHQSRRDELLSRLGKWQEKTGDERVLGARC